MLHRESGERMIITNIATRFQLNETNPESTVRKMIENGTLSGIPLDASFFFVFCEYNCNQHLFAVLFADDRV